MAEELVDEWTDCYNPLIVECELYASRSDLCCVLTLECPDIRDFTTRLVAENVLRPQSVVSRHDEVSTAVSRDSSDPSRQVDVEGVPHFSTCVEIVGKCESDRYILTWLHLGIDVVLVGPTTRSEEVKVLEELAVLADALDNSFLVEVVPGDCDLASSHEGLLLIVN